MSDNEPGLGAAYLAEVRRVFARQQALAERALAQVNDEHFFDAPGPDENSIAIIVKHMGGNMRSRWRDFLATDGEKPDRDRDGEFELRGESRQAVMERWQQGWQVLFSAIEGLGPDDVLREVRIRGEAHTVLQAIERQVDHYAYHVGQVVQLARHFAGTRWETLSIARGASQQFNEPLRQR